MIGKMFHPLHGDLSHIKRLRAAPGNYVIVAGDRNGRPVSVPRACGVDREGILYIGRSSNLQSRLATLRNMICPLNGVRSKSGHIFGHTYWHSKKFYGTFRAKRLMFTFEHHPNPDSRETKRLNSYLNRFGELPPGNGTLPNWRKDALSKSKR